MVSRFYLKDVVLSPKFDSSKGMILPGSTGDVRALIDFSSRVPHGKSIVIKAIVPNGFYYQMTIPSGIGR